MMFDRVTDVTPTGARWIGRTGIRNPKIILAGVAALIGALVWAPPGFSQSAQESTDPPVPRATSATEPAMRVTIRRADDARQRLVVPLDRSIILETSAPIVRAQTVEATIASIQSISPTLFLVTGVGYGMTQVVLWTPDEQRQVVEVRVELNLDLLNEMLAEIDPQSDATATSVMGNIVLTGTVSSADTAQQAVQVASLFIPRGNRQPQTMIQNHLRVVGERQVLLHCTVAEVNRSATRKLGFNGFLAGDDFRDAFVVNQVGGINPMDIGPAGNVNVLGAIPFLTGAAGIPLSSAVPLSIGFPRMQMQVFIQAMRENSLLRILAEPTLVAISGETASFLAGGEFPIPVPQSGSAAGSVTIEFREFGVRVNFTPVVLSDQRIRMRVAPEVSETDFSTAVQIQGFVVPGLTQRRVETTIEVGNGQTIAIAGLLADEVRGLVNKVPGLGDVPVLGALFRSIEYKRRQTELVILVTPEIIAPLDPHQLTGLPGENLSAPSDYELYALGVLEGRETGRQPVDVYRTKTPNKVRPQKSEPEELSIHGPWGYSTNDDL